MSENVFDKAKISDEEWSRLQISRLSSRPNAKTAYGSGGYDANAMKAAFDAQGNMLKEHHNSLVDSLSEIGRAEAKRQQAEDERKESYKEAELERNRLYGVAEDARNAEFAKKEAERSAMFVASRNLMTLKFENAQLTSDGAFYPNSSEYGYAASPEYLAVKGGTTYTLSWLKQDVTCYVYIYEYADADYTTLVGQTLKDYSLKVNSKKTFTTTATTKYIRIKFWGTEIPWEDLIPDNFQLEEGEVATEYVPPMVIDPNLISMDEVYEVIEESGERTTEQIDAFTDDIKAFIGSEKCPVIKDHYVILNGENVTDADIRPSTEGYTCASIDCEYGDTFSITGKGASHARLWAFADESGRIISVSPSGNTQTDYLMSAPYGAAKLYANSSGELIIYKGKPLVKRFDFSHKTVADVFNLLATNNYDLISKPLDFTCLDGVTFENGIVHIDSFRDTTGKHVAYAYAKVTESGSFYATGVIEENENCFIDIVLNENKANQKEFILKDKTGIVFTADKGDTIKFIIYVRANTQITDMTFAPKLSYFTPRGAQAEVLPSNYPQEVGYRKSQQWVNLKWTPKGEIPMQGGAKYFPANVERKGMLYGEGAYQDKRVGADVSLLTFMTAINNPYSLMYTENTNKTHTKSAYGVTYYGDGNSGAYMGMSCNIFVYNSLGSPITYSSFETDGDWMVDEGLVEKVYDQSAHGLALCDILANQGHVRMITRLWKDARNVINRIQVSEIIGSGATNVEYDVDSFNAMLQSEKYGIYRYKNLYKNIHYEKSPFVALDGETIDGYVYNNDICTFAGDYATFAEGDLLHINYTKGQYTSMQIYKNDVLIETISINDGHDIDLTNKGYTYGKYKARLTNGTNHSDFTYWEILNLTLTLDGEYADYSTTNGKPVFWSWCNKNGWHEHKHDLQGQPKENRIKVGTPSKSGYTYLKVYVDGDYGRIARRIAKEIE